jgi:hypothetical protein
VCRETIVSVTYSQQSALFQERRNEKDKTNERKEDKLRKMTEEKNGRKYNE